MKNAPSTPARISEDELLRVSARNENLRFELVDGELIVMPPAGGYYAELEMQYVTEVALWCRSHAGRCFSPSAGFRFANGDVRAPDAAVILPGHPAYDDPTEKFIPGAPDFLIEILSGSDSLQELKRKMQIWIQNGAKLAFLIDPLDQKAYVYRKDLSITEYPYTATLTGEDVLSGFSVVPSRLDPRIK